MYPNKVLSIHNSQSYIPDIQLYPKISIIARDAHVICNFGAWIENYVDFGKMGDVYNDYIQCF